MAEPMSAKGGMNTDADMIISKKNKVFHIQFNRPKRKNAFTTQMYFNLTSALQEAAKDPDVYVAVLTGTGQYFSSGNDLANFTRNASAEEAQKLRKEPPVLKLLKVVIDFPKPLIALVNGPAIGIAVTLLGLCDAVYCSDKATFLTPFTQLALSAEGCSSYIFPKIMGTAKATEILLFNKTITAQEAYERNLVTRVFPDAEFRKETEAVVAYIASLPTQSMRASKSLLRSREREMLHKVNEEEMRVLTERLQSPEMVEALSAFFARQKAKL